MTVGCGLGIPFPIPAKKGRALLSSGSLFQRRHPSVLPSPNLMPRLILLPTLLGNVTPTSSNGDVPSLRLVPVAGPLLLTSRKEPS